MGGAVRHARHLLLHAVPALGPRAERARPGGADRPAEPRFYFFFIEIWPQEVYYLTGLLIIAAMALFLMNAVAGRDLVRLSLPADGLDRPVPGDRALVRRRPARAHAARAGPLDRRARSRARGAKHFLWLMVAWWTGGAWVLYFADAPTLVQRSRDLQRAVRRLSLDRHPDLHDLCRSPATCASRSASICVRGRASRRR